jgi:DNA-binding transcriptional MerR regulator
MVFYLLRMTIVAPPATARFSKSELSALSGAPLGVVSFWSKQGLLLASEGGAGKGSHRKYDRGQVSIAALLMELQKHGLNIAKLRSFAELLQRGRKACLAMDLHWQDYAWAAQLREKLDAFRAGAPVNYTVFHPGRPARERVEKRVATEERHVLAEHFFGYFPGERDIAAIRRFAEAMDPADTTAIQMFNDILSQMEGDVSDPSWLIWTEGDEWKFSGAIEKIDFVDFPDIKSAIYLGVGAVLRSVWSIDKRERKRIYWENAAAEYAESMPHLAADLLARAREDDAN